MVSLSIIIPHYNSTGTLVELLESIPNKKEIQILVIDDHSNEREKQKLQKIKDSNTHENIKFLVNDPNKKGAGSSRNVGLVKAIGEWILFADSDDFFVDGFYNTVKKHFDTDSDVVFFKPTSVELDTGNPSNRHVLYAGLVDDYYNSQTEEAELKIRYRFVVPWSKLIKREVITNNNISFDDVIVSNDVMFSMRLGYYSGAFDVSTNTIYCVTISKGSLTTSVNEEVFDTRLSVFIKSNSFLKDRLSKDNFNTLDISGQNLVKRSRNYGLRKVFEVIKILKSNRVKLISRRALNPAWLLKKEANKFFWRNKTKRFYEKG